MKSIVCLSFIVMLPITSALAQNFMKPEYVERNIPELEIKDSLFLNQLNKTIFQTGSFDLKSFENHKILTLDIVSTNNSDTCLTIRQAVYYPVNDKTYGFFYLNGYIIYVSGNKLDDIFSDKQNKRRYKYDRKGINYDDDMPTVWLKYKDKKIIEVIHP